MKRLLLPLVAVATLTSGCDPEALYAYIIQNDTQHEIVIHIEDNSLFSSTVPVTIPRGERRTVHSYSRLGGIEEFIGTWPDIHPVTINGEPTSDDFWKKKYWKTTKRARSNSYTYTYTYTLTLTDDLLELFLSEEDTQTN